MAIITRSTIDLVRQKKLLLERVKRNMSRALKTAEGEIIKRTQSGKEINGGSFAKYDPDYAEWKSGGKGAGANRWAKYMTAVQKKKVGLRKLKITNPGAPGVSDTVNLTLSGKMLQSMTSDVTIEGAEVIGRIYFNTPDGANKARWNDPKRPFFGLSKEQKRAIFNAIRQTE